MGEEALAFVRVRVVFAFVEKDMVFVGEGFGLQALGKAGSMCISVEMDWGRGIIAFWKKGVPWGKVAFTFLCLPMKKSIAILNAP